ncbi:MAG: OsmC family protein [Myxococcales bacterium]|nr:OsmC family protein [Myxococcales bacterium]
MDPAGEFTLHIDQVEGFEFRVRFDKPNHADLILDEPAPLGRDLAPNPARILAASIGDCLSASLVFCLKRRGVVVSGLRSEVKVTLVRNEKKRLRVGRVAVSIHPREPLPEEALRECLETFEDFCVVTQSVREGIDVSVDVALPDSNAGNAPPPER